MYDIFARQRVSLHPAVSKRVGGTLKEERRLMVFENRVLRGMFVLRGTR
jgi:hypothetical protein